MTGLTAWQLLASAGLLAILPLLLLDRLVGGRPVPSDDELGTNLALGAIVILSDAIVVSGFAHLYEALSPRIALIRIEPAPLQLLIALIAGDFLSYWHHRAMHRFKWLWASHVVHHQSRRIDLSTGLRNHPFGTVSQCIFWAPLLIVGVGPSAMLLAAGAIGLWVMLIHRSEAHCYPAAPTPVRWLINMPAHHREHHRDSATGDDCNFGLLFILWDRIFGTYRAPDEQRSGFGVAGIRPIGPIGELLWGEWRTLLGAKRPPPRKRNGAGLAAGTAAYITAAALLVLVQTAAVAGR